MCSRAARSSGTTLSLQWLQCRHPSLSFLMLHTFYNSSACDKQTKCWFKKNYLSFLTGLFSSDNYDKVTFRYRPNGKLLFWGNCWLMTIVVLNPCHYPGVGLCYLCWSKPGFMLKVDLWTCVGIIPVDSAIALRETRLLGTIKVPVNVQIKM